MSRRATRSVRLAVEGMEARLCPFTAVQLGITPVTLKGHTLVVRGTPENDEIKIEKAGGNLVVGKWAVAAKAVAGIEIQAGAGDDLVSVSPAIFKPTLILGGDGNDTVFGGSGPDRIYGGNGDDELYGRGGNDLLVGEAGNDLLSGGSGLDQLFDNYAVRKKGR